MTQERFPVPIIETAWQHGLVAPAVEFDATGVVIQEIRIRKILDQQEIAGEFDPATETSEGFLQRYRDAREVVQTTPVPEDFNEVQELKRFYDDMIETNSSIQAGHI